MSCRCHNNAAFVSTQLCYGQVDLAQAVMPGADFQTTQCYADWLTAGMLLLMSWQVCLCTLTIRCRASAFAPVALSIKERKQHAVWIGNLVTDSPTLLGRQHNNCQHANTLMHSRHGSLQLQYVTGSSAEEFTATQTVSKRP